MVISLFPGKSKEVVMDIVIETVFLQRNKSLRICEQLEFNKSISKYLRTQYLKHLNELNQSYLHGQIPLNAGKCFFRNLWLTCPFNFLCLPSCAKTERECMYVCLCSLETLPREKQKMPHFYFATLFVLSSSGKPPPCQFQFFFQLSLTLPTAHCPHRRVPRLPVVLPPGPAVLLGCVMGCEVRHQTQGIVTPPLY